MHMHQGYVLKLPNKFLQQHGGKIRDGLTVLKCIAAIGKCAGLPLSLEGMPRNVVSMAIRLGPRSRQWPLTLVATYLTIACCGCHIWLRLHAPRLGPLTKMLICR